MKQLTTLTLALFVVCGTPSILPAEVAPKAIPATIAPNAAVIYWQAFSAMPNLNDEQRKLLDSAVATTTTPLTDDLKPIVALYGIALNELHRAGDTAVCDWQLDTSAGPALLLPHLQKARDLSRVALLRARQRFAAGETDAAVSDVIAALKLARDCGSSPILISLLVDVAIEKAATDVLCRHLPQLNKEQLGLVEQRLVALPPTSNLAAAIRWEEQAIGEWLERTINKESAKLADPQAGYQLLTIISPYLGISCNPIPQANDVEGREKAEMLQSITVADVQASQKQLLVDFAELSRIAGLPFDERKEGVQAFVKSLSSTGKMSSRKDFQRYFSRAALPDVGKILDREEQFLIRRQLLEQAVRVQRDGVEALQPIHGKKVAYRKTNHGFELSCPSSTETVTVEIGSSVSA